MDLNNINWIHNLIYKKNLKINLLDLKIPGTFDSGNYNNNKQNHLNVFLQLCNGIRFLDINIRFNKKKNKFIIVNKYHKETITLLELFKDILKFMIKYKDPIILNINYINIKLTTQLSFEKILIKHFKNFLVTGKDIFNININEMQLSQLLSKNKKLIVLTESGTFINKVYFNFINDIKNIDFDVNIKRSQCLYDKKNNHTKIYKNIDKNINFFLLKKTITAESINSINQIILSNMHI